MHETPGATCFVKAKGQALALYRPLGAANALTSVVRELTVAVDDLSKMILETREVAPSEMAASPPGNF